MQPCVIGNKHNVTICAIKSNRHLFTTGCPHGHVSFKMKTCQQLLQLCLADWQLLSTEQTTEHQILGSLFSTKGL